MQHGLPGLRTQARFDHEKLAKRTRANFGAEPIALWSPGDR